MCANGGMRGDAFTLQGLGGGEVLSSGEFAFGPFREVYAQTDVVLGQVIGNLLNGSAFLTGASVAAGTSIGGITDFVEVVEGIVTAYRMS